MNRPAAHVRGNIYYNDFEMRCKEESVDGGIYDFVMENEVIPEPKQVPLERREPAWKKKKSSKESPHSCHSVLAAVQRMLCIVTMVVIVSFLTAAGTLALALKMMFTQNNLANNCSTLPGKLKNQICKNIQCLLVVIKPSRTRVSPLSPIFTYNAIPDDILPRIYCFLTRLLFFKSLVLNRFSFVSHQ